MFSKTISKLKEENKNLSDDNEIKGFRIKDLASKLDDKEKEIDEIKRENYREVRDIKKDFESKERILRNELNVEKQEALRAKELEVSELREKNGIQAKEIEILTKAFENMGFDVKDMKAILDKLVDGIVSKNSINLVK